MPENHPISEFELNLFDDRKDIILILGPTQKFSECFINAISIEFPSFEIKRIESLVAVGELSISQVNRVCMIIMHEHFCTQLGDVEMSIRKIFPSHLIVFAYHNHNQSSSTQVLEKYTTLFDSHLPMDVRLDVWLAIIRLLLAGGTYISPELNCHSHLNDSISSEPNTNNFESQDSSQVGEQSKDTVLSKLTCRELDVLKLVAEGQQNKVIAGKLGLSEHTIKLHLHHIISKLKVTNRTEATALFLSAGHLDYEL